LNAGRRLLERPARRYLVVRHGLVRHATKADRGQLLIGPKLLDIQRVRGAMNRFAVPGNEAIISLDHQHGHLKS
jgi:hypothetical protein